jgi:hypothetical protein
VDESVSEQAEDQSQSYAVGRDRSIESPRRDQVADLLRQASDACGFASGSGLLSYEDSRTLAEIKRELHYYAEVLLWLPRERRDGP